MANHPNRGAVAKIRALRREYREQSSLNQGLIRGAVDTTEIQNEIARLIRTLSPRQRANLDKQPI